MNVPSKFQAAQVAKRVKISNSSSTNGNTYIRNVVRTSSSCKDHTVQLRIFLYDSPIINKKK